MADATISEIKEHGRRSAVDGSFIPWSGAVNQTLTIVAIAPREGD